MTNIADIAITTIDTIKGYSLTGVPRFILDELQDATIANTQEKGDITGKQGRKLGNLKRNKGVIVSGTNGLVSAGLMEAQIGTEFETKASTPVTWTDYLTVNDDAATTSFVAAGTAGAEIEALYIRNSDGSCGDKLDQAATAAAGKFAYAPATKTLSFFADEVADGTEIVVFYTRNIAGEVLKNESDKYSEKLRVYVDGTGEDKCGNVYHLQFYIPKGDFSGDFDLAMGDNQAVHAFEIESLSGACNNANGYLWTYTVFGVNAADVVNT